MAETARATIYLDGKQAEQALAALGQKAKDLSKQLSEARKAGDMVSMKKINTELKQVEAAQKSLTKETFNYKKVMDNLSGASINDLRKALKTVETQMNRMNRTDPGFKEMQQNAKKLREEISGVTSSMRSQQTMTSRLTGSIKGLLPAFGFAAIIAGAAKGAKALFDLYQETARARREAERLTGLSGQPLSDFTSSVQATAKTFNQDFSQVLVGVNSFAKTMGISVDEALRKVNDGFITGADSSGELLNIIKEYGPQFKAAGLSADESIALISQQVKSGIYSDKGIDTIKEATISLREMTKGTREAIDGIGLSSGTMQQQLRDGTITVFDAIQQISRRLADLPPQSAEVGTAIADIFRGAGEDAGLEYITMLGTAEMSLQRLKTGAGENAIAQERLLQANEKLSKAWGDLMGTGTGTLSAIKAFAIDLTATGITKVANGIKGIRDWFVELYNESLPIRAGFQYMFATWATGFNVIKTALQALWEQLRLGGNLIKAILTFDLSGIKDAFVEYGNNMRSAVVNNAQNAGSAWKKAWENTLNGELETVTQPVKTEVINPSTGKSAVSQTRPVTAKEGADALKKVLEALDRAHEERLLRIEQQAVEEKKSMEYLNLERAIAERAYLEQKLAILQEAGLSGIEIQRTLIQREIDLIKQADDELKRLREVNVAEFDTWLAEKTKSENDTLSESINANIEYAKAVKKTQEQQVISERETLANRADNIMAFTESIGNSFQDFLTGQNGSFEDFMKQTLLATLDFLEKMLVAAIAQETIKSIMEGAPLNPLAVAKAVGKIILLKAAFGVAKAAIMGKQKSQEFESGGYTGDGKSDEPAGVVHKGEWVAPAWQVNDPASSAIIAMLEKQRQNPTRINTAAIRNTSRGYNMGGFVSDQNPNDTESFGLFTGVSPIDQRQNEILEKVAIAVDKLLKWQPKVYTEMIKKDLKTLDSIEQNRGM